MSEDEILVEEQEVFKEKRKVFKFRYNRQPPKEECLFQKLMDYQPVEFVHKNLQQQKRDDVKVQYVEENTLLIIKPSGMMYKDEIRKRIFEEGFSTLKEKTVWLEAEQMSEFYTEHYGKPWFPKFIFKMVSGPIHIMVLGKYNAIEDLKILMGNKKVSVARNEAPYSLRALYGLKGDSATNGVHGSYSRSDAQREIRFFFPEVISEPMPEVIKYIDYLQENIYDTVVQGLMELKTEKPDKPIPWLSNWFLYNSKDTPLIEPEYLMKISSN